MALLINNLKSEEIPLALISQFLPLQAAAPVIASADPLSLPQRSGLAYPTQQFRPDAGIALGF